MGQASPAEVNHEQNRRYRVAQELKIMEDTTLQGGTECSTRSQRRAMLSIRDQPVSWRRPREGCRVHGRRASYRSRQTVELVAVGVQATGKSSGRALRFEPPTSGFPSACPVALQRRGQLCHLGFGAGDLAIETSQRGPNQNVPSALPLMGP